MSFLNYAAAFSTANLKAMRKVAISKQEFLNKRFKEISEELTNMVITSYEDPLWFGLRTKQNDLREMIKATQTEINLIDDALHEHKQAA